MLVATSLVLLATKGAVAGAAVIVFPTQAVSDKLAKVMAKSEQTALGTLVNV